MTTNSKTKKYKKPPTLRLINSQDLDSFEIKKPETSCEMVRKLELFTSELEQEIARILEM